MNTTIRKTHPLAIASVVSGGLSWTVLPILGFLIAATVPDPALIWMIPPVLGFIVSIVAGHVARNKIQQQSNFLQGRGFALTGLALGYVGIVIAVLLSGAIVLAILAARAYAWH